MIECITDNEEINIKLSGNLTIQDAPELKDIMLKSLEGMNVIIEIKSNLEADISILQIIHSAVKTAESLGRILVIKFRRNERFAEILELSGFYKVLQNNLNAEE